MQSLEDRGRHLPLTKVSTNLCAKCKGARRLCGLPRCPIVVRLEQQLAVAGALKTRRELYSPTPPSVLVGEQGYPYVRVGVNLTPSDDKPGFYENPGKWWGRLGLYDIIRLRASMVFSNKRLPVKSVDERVAEAVLEAAASAKPVYSEVYFRKPPKPRPIIDAQLKPVGMQGEVERISITENPKIPKRVDRVMQERVPARKAVVELYEAGLDVYYIQRVFSAAGLGVRRRLVPTRWTITAVDKIVSQHILRRVKNYKEYPAYEVYHTSYIGNRYTILLMPGAWSMEMIEAWLPHTVWVPGGKPYIYTVHELADGKPSDEDGGYYAIRLPVLEFLDRQRRQARVLVVREITPEYFAPVGSWQIRESVRNALRQRPEEAGSLEEALTILARRTTLPFEEIAARSKLLDMARRQRLITSFI